LSFDDVQAALRTDPSLVTVIVTRLLEHHFPGSYQVTG
jgi:hypothetical protein